jgi:hypothetical protein
MEENATVEGIEEDKDGKDKTGLGFTQCGEASREAGLRVQVDGLRSTHPTAEDSSEPSANNA